MPNSNKKAHKTCPRCGKAYSGTCYLESRMCFKCGKTGHFIKDCPALKNKPMAEPNDLNQRPKIQGRVFAITGQDAEESKLGNISLHLSLCNYCVVMIVDKELMADLILLKIYDFGII